MSYRAPKIPWPKDQYVIIEEHNELWLRGSFMRAMQLGTMSDRFGYKVLLGSQEFIDKLRKDPSLRNETWYVKEGPGKIDTEETKDE